MTRKNLKKSEIEAKKVISAARKKNLPAFDEKRKRFKFVRMFFCDNKGNPSKRAFFFSMFSFLSAWYAVYIALNGFFDVALGTFLLGCAGASGYAYHRRDKAANLIQGIQGIIAPEPEWPKPPARR